MTTTTESSIASWGMSYFRHDIRLYPHPDLKKVAVANPDDEDQRFPRLSEFLDSNGMMSERNGVAIAANQTGRQGRWWVMNGSKGRCVIINAKMDLLGPFAAMDEGCLSFPKQYAKVKRSLRCRVQGLRLNLKDLTSERFDEVWEGVDAQIAQHENDHLYGILFIDHLDSPERTRIKGNLLKLKKQGKTKP